MITISRDGQTLALSAQLQRVLETALTESQRAFTNRVLHARREGRIEAAEQMLVCLDRLQVILDFLLGRGLTSTQEKNT